MKKVLWITTEFPPIANVAATRNIKFLKYLPELGWEVVVITPSETIEHTEASHKLLDQLNSSVTISRTFPNYFSHLENKRYIGYLIRNIVPPDSHIFWILLSLLSIEREIAKHKPDLIYTTCSPFSINFIGAWVKLRHNIPWVTDFRDLWTLNPLIYRTTPYYRFVSERLERFYLKQCDALIVTSHNSQNRMLEKYPELNNKIFVIHNGFDSDDIPVVETNNPMPKSLFYSGTIYERTSHNPLYMLKLLAYLDDNKRLDLTSWELHYSGGKAELFAKMVSQSNGSIKYHVHGYLDHINYYRLIQSMAYVYICMPQDIDTQSWLPARLYDYIGNKSRIICFATRDSEVVHLLEKYGNGLILFYDEPMNVQAQKLEDYLSQQNNVVKISEEFVTSFSRKSLTCKLARLFEQVTQ